MSEVNERVCDVCGKKVEPNVDGFFIFPARRFYKYKYDYRSDKTIKYPKDMCRKCFDKFIIFCNKKNIENEE